MKEIESLIGQSAPQEILSAGFMVKLRVLIMQTSKATISNPLGAAAGLAMAVLSALIILIAAIGRFDLLPEIISSVLKIVGGS